MSDNLETVWLQIPDSITQGETMTEGTEKKQGSFAIRLQPDMLKWVDLSQELLTHDSKTIDIQGSYELLWAMLSVQQITIFELNDQIKKVNEKLEPLLLDPPST